MLSRFPMRKPKSEPLWTQSSLPATANWCALAKGLVGGVTRIVVIASGTNAGAYTDSDGATWTRMNMPASSSWSDVTFNPGKNLFVAVSTDGPTAYSANGISWTSGATLANPMNSISVFSNTFVGTGIKRNTRGATSIHYGADGKTWTETQGGLPAVAATNFWKLTEDESQLVAVLPGYQNICYTSNPTGTWTAAKLPASSSWSGVVNGGSRYAAVAANTSGMASGASPASMGAATLPLSANWQGIAHGNGKFVVVGRDTDIAPTSEDATTWGQSKLPTGTGWNSVIYGASRFVAIAYGTANAAFSNDL